MLESLEILEFTFGSFVALTIGFVKDFDAGNFASVVDVGSDTEAAFEKVAEEVHFTWAGVVELQRLLLAFVRQRNFFGI